MRKIFQWLRTPDKHGDTPMTFIVFFVVIVGTLLAIGSMRGH